MTTFDKREDAFESKFAHDAELQFKAEARRNKLLGLWAAALLGKTGDDAEEYAKTVVAADLDHAGHEDVFRKIRGRFRRGRRGPVRPPDPPHHGRADGARRWSRCARRRSDGMPLPALAGRLRNGETLYCGWVAMPEPLVAETVARAGFDASCSTCSTVCSIPAR